MKLFLKINTLLTEFFYYEKDNKYNYFALGVVAILAHILFGLYWTYIDPQPYESIVLRGIGVIICFGLISIPYWKENIHKFIYYYWIFAVIYNLPFFFTTNLIRNGFSDMWFVAEPVMIFVTVLFLTDFIKSIMAILVGILLAIIFCSITAPEMVYFNHNILKHSPIFVLTFIASYVFSFSNSRGLAVVQEIRNLQSLEAMKSIAGSIAHELRNPLNSINFAQTQVKELLLDESTNNKNHILELTSHIADSISNANNIINIILSDLSEKKIDPEDFVYLEPNKILPEILEKYGYKSDEEKAKVKLLSSEDNFLIKAVPDRLAYIVFNLLKNALYYLNQYPDSIITVGAETSHPSLRTKGEAIQKNYEITGLPRYTRNDGSSSIDYNKYNVIYIYDTGPGIPSNIISKLFGDFYTSGKKEGTGLGLSFCKRNMQMFGGDIICESEFGQGKNGWTKFSLLFPKLSKEEVDKAMLEGKKKKILLVDDQEINLITTKSKIEKILLYISCDIAKSGKEAIEMVKQNKYQLILMDFQMPEMSGIETTKRIKNYDKEIPIIAFTSLDKKSFLEEIKKETSENYFDYYLNKSSENNLLYRTIGKWINNSEDDLSYLGNKEDYLKILQGKKAILADDQQMNRVMTKINLENAGLIVTEASDGKELLEIYQKSLNENGISSFDAIITDINMPPFDGDTAAKEIRKIESSYKISHHDEIPIIALSGDGKKEDVHHFFDCQITDYFIKGSKPEILLRIIANYLTKRESKIEIKIIPNDDLNNGNSENLKSLNQSLLDNFSKEEQVTILDLFIKNSDELMLKINENKNAGDIKNLLLHIHSLKGTAANIGANRLFNYIKIVEQQIKNNNAPQNWMEEMEKIYLELKN